MAWRKAQPGLRQFAAVAAATAGLSLTAGSSAVAGSADFQAEPASPAARDFAQWVMGSGDHAGLPFVIVDKIEAKVFVFHSDGRLRAAAPALLGLARGDHSVPGIGERKLSSIKPAERTTPAGRFVAALGANLKGNGILWVDYAAAVSLHPVVTTNPKESRLSRLNSPTVADNRISYGCINVPPAFFAEAVRPAFTGTSGVVYILPEVRPMEEVFPVRSSEPQPGSSPAEGT